MTDKPPRREDVVELLKRMPYTELIPTLVLAAHHVVERKSEFEDGLNVCAVHASMATAHATIHAHHSNEAILASRM